MLDGVGLDFQREPLSETDLALYCGRYCHVASYQRLLEAIRGGFSVVLTGPDGVGKGALLQRLRQEVPAGLRFIDARDCPESLEGLLGFLCDRLALSSSDDSTERRRVLAEHLQRCRHQGSQLLLVLEQAEHLNSGLLGDLLESLIASPEALPQVLISGSTGLGERLMWLEFIEFQSLVRCHLSRLNPAETRDLLRWSLHYLGVSTDRLGETVMDSLVQQTQGLPGRAIALCEYVSTLSELDPDGELLPELLTQASSELELVDEGYDDLPLMLEDLLLQSEDAPEDNEELVAEWLDEPMSSPAPQPPDGDVGDVDIFAHLEPAPGISQVEPDEPDEPEWQTQPGGWRQQRPLMAISASVVLAALAGYGIYRQIMGPSLPPAQPARLVLDLPELQPLAPTPQPLQASVSVAPSVATPAVADLEVPLPVAPPLTPLEAPLAPSINRFLEPVLVRVADSSQFNFSLARYDVDVPAQVAATTLSPTQPATTVIAQDITLAETETPPTADMPVVSVPLSPERPWWQENLLATLSLPEPQTGIPDTTRNDDTLGESDTNPVVPAQAGTPQTRVSDRGDSRLRGNDEEVSPSGAGFTQVLRGRGDAYLDRQDPAAARLFFEQAARSGDPLAAMAVAMTHDPVVLAARGLRWSYADAERARDWYQRALEQGHQEAGEYLQALAQWQQDRPPPASRIPPLPEERPLVNFQLQVTSPVPHEYLRSGDRWLLRSDPQAARRLYQAAAEAGSAVASVAVAMTYDPVELQRRGYTGAYADATQALDWYRRARDLGAVGVEARIDRLAQAMRDEKRLASRQP